MNKKYDVVIIGAGIGGLVCGCYLAKTGLKVIIIEQYNKAGGYCTSFHRNGYRFDVGVHYLGGLKRGILGRILDELDLRSEIKFNQFDPTDKIIMPNNITYVRANSEDTIKEFKNSFPKEKQNIQKFFKFIVEETFLNMYKKLYKLTFRDFLNEFFNDYKLKSTLSILLGNIGLFPSRASAVASILLFREFILDPGYYPVGGIGNFSLTLVRKFKQNGGELLLNKRVNKILIKNNKVEGVLLGRKEKIESDIVVSNVDATETFKNMLRKNTKESKLLKELEPSSSLVVLYLGVNEILEKESCNIWKSYVYDMDEYFENFEDRIKNINIPCFVVSFPASHGDTIPNDNKVVQIYLSVPYISNKFWSENKRSFSEKIIDEIEKINIISSDSIVVNEIATPPTFYKYTFNKKGAAFGWASTVDQINPNIFPQITSVNGLFLAGHWCTIGNGQGGIPRVAYSGKRAGELILKRLKKLTK